MPKPAKPPTPNTLLARLKPFNPKRGHVLKTYTCRGVTIRHDRGWHEVPKALGEYLKTVTSVPRNEDSPLAFEVCTHAEAAERDENEVASKNTVAPAASPVRSHSVGRGGKVSALSASGTMTTADLPGAPSPDEPAERDETAADSPEADDHFADVGKAEAPAKAAKAAPVTPGAPKGKGNGTSPKKGGAGRHGGGQDVPGAPAQGEG